MFETALMRILIHDGQIIVPIEIASATIDIYSAQGVTLCAGYINTDEGTIVLYKLD